MLQRKTDLYLHHTKTNTIISSLSNTSTTKFHHSVLLSKKSKVVISFLLILFTSSIVYAQDNISSNWIRPASEKDPPIYGIKNGIVVGLWPSNLESTQKNSEGGPRGLLRIGYNYSGATYLINFIAVEPVVDDDMEFSEVSPSVVDDAWGKLFWASDSINGNRFSTNTYAKGVITHPDSLHPSTEELTVYVFMEKFLNGAHPYLKLSIRSDAPGELCLQIFNAANSATMQRCALTATMGNYSRLRLLYLKDTIIDSRQLFNGYNGIDFAEKNPYTHNQMLRTKKGDYMVAAESNEDFTQLASWPQQPAYLQKWSWRYRPFFKLTQYWRKDVADTDSSLEVRVNGRVKYWGGESTNPNDYINIPGGAAFENFELREKYHAGKKFYFGLSLKPAKELIDSF